MKRFLLTTAFLAVAAAPVAAQQRFSVEPYVGYGFYGTLPATNTELQAGLAYGGRAAFQLAPQWAIFGNFQRSNTRVEGAAVTLPGFNFQTGQDVNVDHWAAGVEFSYAPRGAEGMLPVILEAGLGQTRYPWDVNDLTVKLGLSSALQLHPNFAIRYGADDYISNYRGDQGVGHQFFARIGGEVRF